MVQNVGAIEQIADEYVTRFAALDPIAATAAGIAGHDDEMTDLSPDGFAARDELNRRTLAALRDVTPADERERTARDAMVERLGVHTDLYAAGEVTSAVNVLSDSLHEVRQVFDLMPVDDDEDWRAIAARLAAVPVALGQLRGTLLEAAGEGRTAARKQLELVADQCASWTDPQRDNMFPALVEQYNGNGALRADLVRGATDATAAVVDFGRFLREELTPHGREQEAFGRDRYQLASRAFLGATVDLLDSYAWGWEELRRISAEMAVVARQIAGPGASVDDAKAVLAARAELRIEGTQTFRDWMQERADATIDALHGTHFDIPEPVRRIECMIAPTSDGGIYYTPPSEDFARPGRMWWAVPHGVTEFSTWREATTIYHEGVPGHHLQVGQAVYQTALLNRWQRVLCWISGHGEGWALYAERLMSDLGFLDDPGERLGMLDGQLFRAARVVLDIGFHLGLRIPDDAPFHPGEQWSRPLALEFLRAHCSMPDETIKFELNRYLGWAGQAPSYKLGERIWLQARDEAKARKGAAFDLKQFHQDALNLGSIGLDPLREALARI
jgi:uncharacterized protein (DUF885 family)